MIHKYKICEIKPPSLEKVRRGGAKFCDFWSRHVPPTIRTCPRHFRSLLFATRPCAMWQPWSLARSCGAPTRPEEEEEEEEEEEKQLRL